MRGGGWEYSDGEGPEKRNMRNGRGVSKHNVFALRPIKEHIFVFTGKQTALGMNGNPMSSFSLISLPIPYRRAPAVRV